MVDLRKKILQTHLKYEKSLYSKHYFESSLITVVGLENNSCQDYIADEIPNVFMRCFLQPNTKIPNKQAFDRTVNNVVAASHFAVVVEEREMLSNNNDK